MRLWPSKRRKSARAIIISEGKMLAFLRKRYSSVTGEWIEYYSIPGGGIDPGETAEAAVMRELYEEMGVEIEVDGLVAHRMARRFEHFVFTARIVSGEPHLMMNSEEAHSMNEQNQFIVEWVDVEALTREKLRYYGDYIDLIKQLASGSEPDSVLQIDVR